MWLAIFLLKRASTFSLSSTGNSQMKDSTNRGKLETFPNVINLKNDVNEKILARKSKKMATEILFGFTNDPLSSLKAEKTGQGFNSLNT